MEIQIGKTYGTREGGTAVVDSFHESEPLFQFMGVCFEKTGEKRIAFWMQSGHYSSSGPSRLDITKP